MEITLYVRFYYTPSYHVLSIWRKWNSQWPFYDSNSIRSIPFCYSTNRIGTYARVGCKIYDELKIGDEFSRKLESTFPLAYPVARRCLSRDCLGKLISCQRASQLATRVTEAVHITLGLALHFGGTRIRGADISIHLKNPVSSPVNFSFYLPFIIPFSKFPTTDANR